MSLILNSDLSVHCTPVDYGAGQDYRDAARLDRYLAIMETNKLASRFVPDDALLALDMANSVCARLSGASAGPGLSAARLALALVQPRLQTPAQ